MTKPAGPPKHAGGDALSDEVRVPREVLEKAVEALECTAEWHRPETDSDLSPDCWCDRKREKDEPHMGWCVRAHAALSALRKAIA